MKGEVMKVSQDEKVFRPITIVIESEAELDYLYALSNSSTTSVQEAAESIGIVLAKDDSLQMNFYYAMSKAKQDSL
jgi:hypothetical protein